jgi:uncharacterized membrane protein (UPF0182 family)
VRVPTDLPSRSRPVRRYQAWILAAVVFLILLLIVVQGIANLYTNYLWYRSVHFTMVWRAMIETKLGLAATFVGVFFIACWISLWVVDRIAPRALLVSPELELVRRYQQIVGRHTFALRTVVSAILALLVGASTSGQWQHWLLFRNGQSFGATPSYLTGVFDKPISFYVFELPFLSFLVDWTLVALLVLLIVTAIGHYLNGGLRFQGPSPRVDPRVTAHLSLILAVMALVRAAGYFYVDRYNLVLANDAVTRGAGYTDVHVRLPAIELLAVVALAVFVLMVFNVYQRSLALPAIGAGLWVLVALAAGVIVPAAVQAFHVTPAQSTLELPYITRNITATRDALNIDGVTTQKFAGASNLTGDVVAGDAATLSNLPLWEPSITSQTYQKLQRNGTGFTLAGLSLDRYPIGGTITPFVIGVREVSAADLPTQSWVNIHLQYTHGYGAILSPANAETDGNPNFDISGVPPVSSDGAPQITQPAVYFGVGQTGYVVADTKQSEVDYSDTNGNTVSSHYSGSGGIPIGSFWVKAAFALRFHDLNLLISNLVTKKSRLLMLQDVRARVAQVAPFLSVDNNPYPVIDNGHLDWIVDAYTTTNYYPYAEQAQTSELPSGSGLTSSFNYVRNSVKVVVDAYTGNMTFYAVNSSDPILNTWEATFPGMFQPLSSMDAVLKAHLRYPQDLLMVQATMYGRYHLTKASTFYTASNAWQLAPTSGTGSPESALPVDAFGNKLRFVPEYEILQLPEQTDPSFTVIEPMDPLAANDGIQKLAALVTAACDYQHYGQLTVYRTLTTAEPNGPGIANSEIQSNTKVSQYVTLVGRAGSTVSLGTTLIVPIDDSLLYVRPLYVSSSQNPYPQLTRFIVVYGNDVAMENTLGAALGDVFGAATSTIGGGPGAVPASVRILLATAQSDYAKGLAALKNEDLATYYDDMQLVNRLILQAETELKKAPKSTSTTGTASAPSPGSASGGGSSTGATTTTTVPGQSATTTTGPPGTA